MLLGYPFIGSNLYILSIGGLAPGAREGLSEAIFITRYRKDYGVDEP